jgi:hypothetical protein
MAQFHLQEQRAKMSAEDPELMGSREAIREALLSVNNVERQLESEYQRLPKRSDKIHEFLVQYSIVYHVSRLQAWKNEGALDPRDERFQLIEAFDKVRELVPQGAQPARKIAKRFRSANDEMLGYFARKAKVVAATHFGSVNPLLRTNFCPTVVLHEDGSRVKVPTALCAMSYENVKARIFVGDLHQLRPFLASKPVNEFC